MSCNQGFCSPGAGASDFDRRRFSEWMDGAAPWGDRPGKPPRHPRLGLTKWLVAALMILASGAGRIVQAQVIPTHVAHEAEGSAGSTDPKTGGAATDKADSSNPFTRLAGDQRALWTSPAKIRTRDAKWLVMLGGATAGMFAADHAMKGHNSLSPSTMKTSVDFS